ncbi:non-homologous end-joining DNA ligase [Nocardia sp. NRRL WC-3656]|uniref:non-homologous end-joining DNA ligase n=1 Tax=Nocardia sp. NRRL WC-3656 TaxID=1463824 RepID=UPI001E3C3326|nr:non-homologous end-joining DNA ligase [Nocardia sp. NRRL WC-3656]
MHSRRVEQAFGGSALEDRSVGCCKLAVGVIVGEGAGDGGEAAVTKLPRYAAMLAAPGELPSDDEGWAFEIKYDGIRAGAYVTDRVQLVSRNGNDVTAAWPELADLAAQPPFVLDGEIVAFVEGHPSFEALQSRMHRSDAAAIAAMAAMAPATFVAFDLLHVADRSLIELSYLRRRELLEQLALPGPRWRISPRLTGRGQQLLARSQELGLEGLIAKRLDGRYLPGRRSPSWTKIKNLRISEVIVVGWRPGAGSRCGRIGSLLVAVPDHDGNLIWAGNVGTGFTRIALADLHAKLTALQRDTPPIVNSAVAPEAKWVHPRLVGVVAFTEWTHAGILRHPSWRGLRDIDPDRIRPPDWK